MLFDVQVVLLECQCGSKADRMRSRRFRDTGPGFLLLTDYINFTQGEYPDPACTVDLAIKLHEAS